MGRPNVDSVMKVSQRHRLERRARRIGGALVVAGDDPDATGAALDANLRRPEDVTGRMKADADVAERDRLAVREGLDRGRRSEPSFEQATRGLGAEICLAAGPRVIAVDVRDQGAIGRPPRVHMEAAGRAEEARGLSISIGVRSTPVDGCLD